MLETGDAWGEALQFDALRGAVEAEAGEDCCVDERGDLREGGVGEGGAEGVAD